MQIEIDPTAMFAEGEILYEEGSGENSLAVAGINNNGEFLIGPQMPLDLILTYCHENGHFWGDRIFFRKRNILGKSNILTLDEVKAQNTTIDLTPEELDYLKNNVHSRARVRFSKIHEVIGAKLVNRFLNGKFKPSKVCVVTMSDEDMRYYASENNVGNTERRGGVTISVNDKHGRDQELASTLAEITCLLILENTLKRYGLMDKAKQFIVPAGDAYHQRAQNIIARAFLGKGWRIPSMKDLGRADMD